MDPYSGMHFGGDERPAGSFFVDFGLGDTLGGFGPLIPFAAAGGLAWYTGGEKAFGNMIGSSQLRGVKAGMFGQQMSSKITGSRLHSLIPDKPLGGMYEQTGGKTVVGGQRAARLRGLLATEAQGVNLASDVTRLTPKGKVPGAKGAGRGMMSRLYQHARRQGYDVFSRYGMATGARIATAGVATGAFRFLEGIALLTFGAEAGRMLFQSVADWHPAQEEGPKVDFGDEGYASVPAAAMTQRRRALQAIHNSQLGVRAALGNEASFLH